MWVYYTRVRSFMLLRYRVIFNCQNCATSKLAMHLFIYSFNYLFIYLSFYLFILNYWETPYKHSSYFEILQTVCICIHANYSALSILNYVCDVLIICNTVAVHQQRSLGINKLNIFIYYIIYNIIHHHKIVIVVFLIMNSSQFCFIRAYKYVISKDTSPLCSHVDTMGAISTPLLMHICYDDIIIRIKQ